MLQYFNELSNHVDAVGCRDRSPSVSLISLSFQYQNKRFIVFVDHKLHGNKRPSTQGTSYSDNTCESEYKKYVRPHKKFFLFPVLWRLKSDARMRFLFLFFILSKRLIWDFWEKNNFTFSTYHVKCIFIIEVDRKSDRNVFSLK